MYIHRLAETGFIHSHFRLNCILHYSVFLFFCKDIFPAENGKRPEIF